jgi:hypothetical protein
MKELNEEEEAARGREKKLKPQGIRSSSQNNAILNL